MEQMKTCTKCSKTKILNEQNFIWRETYWIGKCRDCVNEERREKRAEKKGTKYTPQISNFSDISKSINTDYSFEKRDYYNMLTSDEITILRDMIKNYKSNKIVFEKIEDIKDKKSISISSELNKKVEELSRIKGLNYSQTLEILIKKALEFI